MEIISERRRHAVCGCGLRRKVGGSNLCSVCEVYDRWEGEVKANETGGFSPRSIRLDLPIMGSAGPDAQAKKKKPRKRKGAT